jgi:hypothetical protein
MGVEHAGRPAPLCPWKAEKEDGKAEWLRDGNMSYSRMISEKNVSFLVFGNFREGRAYIPLAGSGRPHSMNLKWLELRSNSKPLMSNRPVSPIFWEGAIVVSRCREPWSEPCATFPIIIPSLAMVTVKVDLLLL